MIVKKFLNIQQNIRLYHWTTKIYTQHVVSGQLYEKLDQLIDKFIETLMGKKDISFTKIIVSTKKMTKDDMFNDLKNFNNYLLKLKFEKNDSDLQNIRDEILGDINRFMFLLKLK
jgi:hypothetical protein